MLQIKIYPDISSSHTSQIYAGLYELQALGKLNVIATSRCLSAARPFTPHTLWLEAEDRKTGVIRKVCFDLADYGEIKAMHRLRQCDSYFKRSYSQSVINSLAEDLRVKIYPFGLNYESRSIHEKDVLRRWLIHGRIHNTLFQNPLVSSREFVRLCVKSLILKCGLPVTNNNSPLIDKLEIKPDVRAEPKILFLTRVYGPDEAPEINPEHLMELNDMRARIVSALKTRFGGRFIGGLAKSDYAAKHYPESLATENTSKKNFMKLVGQCLIGVATAGLHDSIGWKFPEYIAASRCIVAEKPKYKLPVPLQEMKNYVPFDSPTECIRACQILLEDKDFAATMRHSNYQYYINEASPAAVISRCLATAFKTATA